VFDGDRITLQKIRSGLICLSAALTAHVEAAYEDEAQKNALCMGMFAAYRAEDWLPLMLADLEARERWDQHPDILAWVAAHRLAGRRPAAAEPAPRPAKPAALRRRIEAARPLATANLTRLVAAMDAPAKAPAPLGSS